MNSLEQLYRLQDRILFVRERVRERDTVPPISSRWTGNTAKKSKPSRSSRRA
jgi:hypothetical protein